MDADLERVSLLLADARDPEDLFGTDPIVLPREAQRKRVRAAYAPLKAVTAAAYSLPDDAEHASDLDARLERLLQSALARIELGAYHLPGRRRAVPAAARARCFVVGARRYFVGPRWRSGDSSTFYGGCLELDGEPVGEVLLKVAQSAENSRFLEREASALSILRQEEYRETSYLPLPLDRFDAGGRLGLALRRVDGFNLEEVREFAPHRAGLDPRDAVWMLSRVLAACGLAHRYGIIHGRICPRHVVVEPATHLGMLVGWGGSVVAPARTGQQVLAPIPRFSAPEVSGPTAGPWSDVYSIGQTFLWLVGGEPGRDALPDRVDPRLAGFLQAMVEPDTRRRPHDCWALFAELEQLKTAIWQQRKWRRLDMPPFSPPA
jgi:hypothetical protein